MSRLLQLLAILLIASVTGNALGHEVRPGYLDAADGMKPGRAKKCRAGASIRPSRFPGMQPTSESSHFTLQCLHRARVDCLAGGLADHHRHDGSQAPCDARAPVRSANLQIARLTPSTPTFGFETRRVVAGGAHILSRREHILWGRHFFSCGSYAYVAGWKRV